jgi:hypothetical protein
VPPQLRQEFFDPGTLAQFCVFAQGRSQNQNPVCGRAATGCLPWHFFPLPPALSLIELAFSDPYCADLAMSGISAFGETGHRADIGE